MFDNYFFLRRLTQELHKELAGFKFYKSVSQSKNEIVTGFYNQSTEKFLVFTFQKLPPLFYLRNEFAFAKKNYAEFFNELSDRVLTEIIIDELERNVRIKFNGFQLIFLFRSGHSNVVLINSDDLIVDCFKKADEILHKKFTQIFPPSDIVPDFYSNEEKFSSIFEESSPEMRKYLRILGNLLTEEIKFRAKNFSQTYFESFNQIINEFNDSPLLIYENGIVSFCRLHHLYSQYKISENLFFDLSKTYFSLQKNEEIQSLKEKLLKKLKSEYEHHFQKLQKLRNPQNFINRSEQFRLFGNLILSFAAKIQKGEQQFSIDYEGRKYKIKLNPAKTPFENAEEYFKKAREEETRLKSIENLIEKEELELEKLKNLLNEAENLLDRKKIMEYLNIKDNQPKEKEVTSKFRHFIIDGMYDVYVGKDNKSNDLLTTQFAKPDDLWFHARGVSGSHLIIRRKNKKEQIPKSIIEKAAAIAAYFSKAKNSKLVPVSYTEKKYVIKNKGMETGTVKLIREKVIIVEPKIPEQVIKD